MNYGGAGNILRQAQRNLEAIDKLSEKVPAAEDPGALLDEAIEELGRLSALLMPSSLEDEIREVTYAIDPDMWVIKAKYGH